ncbi:MAG: hypothetical protein ACFFG0_44315 [Candidatus Thorarchaeota archaeon]
MKKVILIDVCFIVRVIVDIPEGNTIEESNGSLSFLILKNY